MDFTPLLEDPDISRMMMPIHAQKGDIILKQGYTTQGLYFITKGRCQLITRIPGERVPIKVATRGPGEVFAEVSFIDQSPMMASVKALSDMQLQLIPNDVLLGLKLVNPGKALKLIKPLALLTCHRIRLSIENLYRENLMLPSISNAHLLQRKPLRKISNANKEPKLALFNLFQLPFFEHIQQECLQGLLKYLKFYRVKKNRILYLTNEHDFSMYYVISGALQTFIHCHDTMSKLSVSGPGGFTGLMGFLDKKPRATSCMTREDSVLLKMNPKDFDPIYQNFSPLTGDQIMLHTHQEVTVSFNRYTMHYLQTKSVYHLF